MADELDIRILRAVQDGFPLEPEPYATVAAELGIDSGELRGRLAAMLQRGEVRRIGASIAHRRAGFDCNVMCVWRVPKDEVDAFAAEAVRHRAVTHCYDREGMEDWPYNQEDGTLNPCLQCDEDVFGPVFKALAGRTRRKSGLAAAI